MGLKNLGLSKQCISPSSRLAKRKRVTSKSQSMHKYFFLLHGCSGDILKTFCLCNLVKIKQCFNVCCRATKSHQNVPLCQCHQLSESQKDGTGTRSTYHYVSSGEIRPLFTILVLCEQLKLSGQNTLSWWAAWHTLCVLISRLIQYIAFFLIISSKEEF